MVVIRLRDPAVTLGRIDQNVALVLRMRRHLVSSKRMVVHGCRLVGLVDWHIEARLVGEHFCRHAGVQDVVGRDNMDWGYLRISMGKSGRCLRIQVSSVRGLEREVGEIAEKTDEDGRGCVCGVEGGGSGQTHRCRRRPARPHLRLLTGRAFSSSQTRATSTFARPASRELDRLPVG